MLCSIVYFCQLVGSRISTHSKKVVRPVKHVLAKVIQSVITLANFILDTPARIVVTRGLKFLDVKYLYWYQSPGPYEYIIYRYIASPGKTEWWQKLHGFEPSFFASTYTLNKLWLRAARQRRLQTQGSKGL